MIFVDEQELEQDITSMILDKKYEDAHRLLMLHIDHPISLRYLKKIENDLRRRIKGRDDNMTSIWSKYLWKIVGKIAVLEWKNNNHEVIKLKKNKRELEEVVFDPTSKDSIDGRFFGYQLGVRLNEIVNNTVYLDSSDVINGTIPKNLRSLTERSMNYVLVHVKPLSDAPDSESDFLEENGEVPRFQYSVKGKEGIAYSFSDITSVISKAQSFNPTQDIIVYVEHAERLLSNRYHYDHFKRLASNGCADYGVILDFKERFDDAGVRPQDYKFKLKEHPRPEMTDAEAQEYMSERAELAVREMVPEPVPVGEPVGTTIQRPRKVVHKRAQ